jgi:hypothetical protein
MAAAGVINVAIRARMAASGVINAAIRARMVASPALLSWVIAGREMSM